MHVIEVLDQEKNLSFCGCVLNPETQLLQTPKGNVRLRNKLWQLLRTLVESSNKLVTREDLVKAIWNGNSYTGEQGLTHAICHLRRVLKKYDISANIITVPKKGYIFQKENHYSLEEVKPAFIEQYSAHSNTIPLNLNNFNFKLQSTN